MPLTAAEVSERLGGPGAVWRDIETGEVRQLEEVEPVEVEPGDGQGSARWRILAGGIPERTGKICRSNMMLFPEFGAEKWERLS